MTQEGGKRPRRPRPKVPRAEKLYGSHWMGLRMAVESDWQSFIDGRTTVLGQNAVKCVRWNEEREKQEREHRARREVTDHQAD